MPVTASCVMLQLCRQPQKKSKLRRKAQVEGEAAATAEERPRDGRKTSCGEKKRNLCSSEKSVRGEAAILGLLHRSPSSEPHTIVIVSLLLLTKTPDTYWLSRQWPPVTGRTVSETCWSGRRCCASSAAFPGSTDPCDLLVYSFTFVRAFKVQSEYISQVERISTGNWHH